MARPLALPVGSVRAICLLGLGARAVLDLRAGPSVAPWLVAAIVVSAAAYFGARASRHGAQPAPADPFGAKPPRRHHPLWLPAGTVRILFLILIAYGAFLWFHQNHGVPAGQRAVAGVLAAFFIGVMVRWFLNQVRRSDDASTLMFEHAQALAAIIAAVGLVALPLMGHFDGVSRWVPPALAAVCTYYAGVR